MESSLMLHPEVATSTGWASLNISVCQVKRETYLHHNPIVINTVGAIVTTIAAAITNATVFITAIIIAMIIRITIVILIILITVIDAIFAITIIMVAVIILIIIIAIAVAIAIGIMSSKSNNHQHRPSSSPSLLPSSSPKSVDHAFCLLEWVSSCARLPHRHASRLRRQTPTYADATYRHQGARGLHQKTCINCATVGTL